MVSGLPKQCPGLLKTEVHNSYYRNSPLHSSVTYAVTLYKRSIVNRFSQHALFYRFVHPRDLLRFSINLFPRVCYMTRPFNFYLNHYNNDGYIVSLMKFFLRNVIISSNLRNTNETLKTTYRKREEAEREEKSIPN